MKRALLLLVALCLLIILALLPLPIPPYLDFQVIYQTDMGLLRGIPVYDHAGQAQMIAQLANVSTDRVYVLPFPYPPWVALALLPLALLPIPLAARIWFELNLLMSVLSIGLLTQGWRTRKRIWAGLAGIFFLPVLGTLFVGQYVIPILLGAALWVYAVRRQASVLVALASVLLTFKPHLGALLLLAGIFYLWRRRDDFGRRALIYILLAGLVLFAVGFLADRAWPLSYYNSLLAFHRDAGASACRLCASLPVALVSLLSHPSNFSSVLLVAAIIFTALVFWLGPSRTAVLKDSGAILAITILATLLSSPYLFSYDFVLLLVPFFFLVERGPTPFEWRLMILAYLIPLIALGIWNRNGDILFSISTLILLILFYREARALDGLHGTA